ncbi:MAG: NADH-quinone oxidoreductase subunit N [Candidatus Margulisiibacteriota bacterium]
MISLLLLTGSGILAMLGTFLPYRKTLITLIVLGYLTAFAALWCPIPSITLFSLQETALPISATLLAIAGILLLLLRPAKQGLLSNPFNHVAILLFSLVGALLMVGFEHMVLLFLGLEILSLPLYVMAASQANSPASKEAALKYFILGAFASSLLLLGITFGYGATHSFVLYDLLTAAPTLYSQLGFLFLLAGLGFKLGIVPFHSWVPDVYEGSPTLYTGYMATVVKLAAGYAFIRIFGFPGVLSHQSNLFAALAVIGMTVGNLMALKQHNPKRILAYSSIAQMGYLLLAFVGTQPSPPSALIYLGAYALASLGTFAVLTLIETKQVPLGGLIKKHPILAWIWILSLLSLAGIPPLPGFLAKITLFFHVFTQGHPVLVIVAVVNSLISLGYYGQLAFTALSSPQEASAE